MDIHTKEGIEDLEKKLEGIKLPAPHNIENAPESIDEAIDRITVLENALDDLVRAVEIAQYSRQYQATDVYVSQAQTLLDKRIRYPEIAQGPEKITVVTGKLSAETIKDIEGHK